MLMPSCRLFLPPSRLTGPSSSALHCTAPFGIACSSPSRMASPDLVWQLVKKNNSFLVKRNGNNNASVQFSSEPNNLYNLNTFKYSGLANKKTIAIVPAGEGLNVSLATTKTKKSHQPGLSVNTSVLKRDFRKMARAVVNQVAENGYRADLKQASLARLAAVHKSLRVAKAGGSKKSVKGPRKALRK